MEIKLSAGDKIQVPANCKATIEEFKEGDILRSKDSNKMVIFKRYDDDPVTFSSYYNNIHAGNSGWGTYYFRHVTEEEKQAFFDELWAKSLRWNAETKEMEEIRKRAKIGEFYLYIGLDGEVLQAREGVTSFDDKNYDSGNYYLLSEREQAEEDSKAVKAIYAKRLKN